MARISEGLITQIWAQSPSSSDDVIAPSDARQESGWGNSYFQPGGDLPEGEHANWLFRRHSAFAYDVSVHGVLEWHADQDFEHPAACFGSDGNLYVSIANSGPSHGGAIDPVVLVGTTRWRLAGSSNQFVPAPQVTGTADAIELAPSPPVLVYTTGLTLIFQAEGDSTAGVTVSVSGLAATPIHFTDGQAGAGDIVTGRFYTIRYDGTNFVVVSAEEYKVRPLAAGGTGASTAAQARVNLGVAPAAAGVPTGGADMQLLAKASGTDYDTEWVTLAMPSGDIEGVTAGDHLSGGGTSGTVRLDVETGTTSGMLAVLGASGRFPAARVAELQNLDGTLDVASGGTGATDAATARTNLAAAAANHNHDARYYTETESDARYLRITGFSAATQGAAYDLLDAAYAASGPVIGRVLASNQDGDWDMVFYLEKTTQGPLGLIRLYVINTTDGSRQIHDYLENSTNTFDRVAYLSPALA